ncbi:MAG TPA: hypothetical protein VEX60_16555 [Pyrinomonadaceae bacterium]|nr:hypothetical protein [Pyrinomonadaceae bacterium]
MTHRFKLLLSCVLTFALLALTYGHALSQGQERAAQQTRQAWTLEEAFAALALQPQDAYLQYVVLQLARRAGRLDEFATGVQRLIPNDADVRAARREGVDLFSLFTGALAVQESLQLDTMRGTANPRAQAPAATSTENRNASRLPQTTRTPRASSRQPARGSTPRRRGGRPTPPAPVARPDFSMPGPTPTPAPYRPEERVAVSRFKAPTIKSHPWVKMLAGRKPEISPLARAVPEDFYFVEFRTLTKLLDAYDAGDLWGAHLFNQSFREAQTLNVGERLKRQLAIETDAAMRPFYDLVVEDVAVTGSDLFAREGSDVTLLFRVKQPLLFSGKMEGFLESAERAHAGARRTMGQYLGVEYVQLATPERDVSVIAADPEPGLHVRSNSLAAFRRVVAAIKGKDEAGRAAKRLGDASEFAYIRTLMPRGDEREDGFVYLSDPFIRRLVGPELKLTERRRLLCYNHLRMIGHASLLFRTEQGRWPDSLEELARTSAAPGAFGEGALSCPDGGQYALSSDKTTGVCSRHGHALRLTPNIEIPVAEVSGAEANEYSAFLDEYNSYWRTFFDPIAIRLKVTPEQYRAETIILPLIDNSIYTRLASALAGPPAPLDAAPVPRRNIFSAAFRFNKDSLLKEFTPDASKVKRDGDLPYMYGLPTDAQMRARTIAFLSNGLGDQVGFHVYDAHPTFDLNIPSLLGQMLGSGVGRGRPTVGSETFFIALALSSLNTPAYLSVPVRDAKIVDDYLSDIDAWLSYVARNERRGRFLNFEYDFYKFPLSTQQTARAFGLRFDPARLRFFWARVGDQLYIASKPFVLEDIVAMQSGAGTPPQSSASQTQRGAAGGDATGHALARVRATNWNEVLADYRLGWAENEREACLNNLGPLADVARALTSRAANPSGEAAPAGDALDRAVLELADRLHGARHFCPEGGAYHVSPDGRAVSCSVHGTASSPRQPAAPSGGSAAGRTMRELSDLTATLTFMEDGLHAVLVVNRK